MRMRKVKHLDSRLDAASGWKIGNPEQLRGKWLDGLMPGASALCLELGCGKGAFLCRSAQLRRDSLFVGFEKIPDAALRGMELAAREDIPNARFVIADAEALPVCFAEGEADEIYLNFSDPWPHWKHSSRRLTHRGFLALYEKVLKPGGMLALKTDNVPLFRFSVRELEASGWQITERTEDLPGGENNIETEYESKFRAQGIKICALRAVRP